MSGSSSHDSPSRKTQPSEDALDGSSSGATALGRTLEAELTRTATRANPQSLTAPVTPAETSAASATPPVTPAGAPADLDLDLISASPDSADASATAAADGDAPAAEDPDADADGDDAQASASRRPRIGWGGVLALLNVVLSGFILMLWGVPRWDGARIGSTARAKNDGAGAGTGARAGTGAVAGANRVDPGRADSGRIDPNRSGTASAGAGGTTSIGASAVAGGATGLPAGLNATSGQAGLRGRATPFGASGAPGASALRGDAGAGDAAGAGGGIEVPELPQAILSVMPGQRAPDVTVPVAAPPPPQPTAVRDDNTVGGALKPGADAAIEAGTAAARTTGDNTAGNSAGNSAAPRVPIAGADGVTMPERLAESHVRPTIAALADGEPVTGEVTLVATIRIDGSVADVQVLSSSRPGAGLEHAAADAVRRWRYKPATRAPQPIDSRLTITVTFR